VQCPSTAKPGISDQPLSTKPDRKVWGMGLRWQLPDSIPSVSGVAASHKTENCRGRRANIWQCRMRYSGPLERELRAAMYSL
jgi:hypothetical protein